MGKEKIHTTEKIGSVNGYGDMNKRTKKRTMIYEKLSRHEIEMFNTGPRVKYRHHPILYQFADWPIREPEASVEMKNLLAAICLLRKEI